MTSCIAAAASSLAISSPVASSPVTSLTYSSHMNGHCAEALPSIVIECFGVPRVLAGARVEACGGTLGDLAGDLARRAPVLSGPVLGPDGWVLPGYVFVVDGRFTRDPHTLLGPESAVLLVASAAGG
jgi:hypothetical protein